MKKRIGWLTRRPGIDKSGRPRKYKGDEKILTHQVLLDCADSEVMRHTAMMRSIPYQDQVNRLVKAGYVLKFNTWWQHPSSKKWAVIRYDPFNKKYETFKAEVMLD